MDKQKRVALLGKSIFLGTIEASLGKYTQFEISSFVHPQQDFQELRELQPDVIIFGLEAEQKEKFLPLLASCPGSLLIGVFPESNDLLVFSSHLQKIQGMTDLIELVQNGGVHPEFYPNSLTGLT